MSPQVIDVRSDTVIKPTTAMLDAMMSAAVGDDVYGEDETVNTLQSRAAELFGMQAAGSTGRHSVRFVFHLDVNDAQVDALTSALRGI